MGALKGDLGNLAKLKAKLRELPLTIAGDVAAKAAPAMTDMTRGAFSGGQTVYGAPRPAGEDGRALTLRRTGAVERELRFVANGTIVRCVLGPKYSRYLIGRYGILPNGALPAAWSSKLRAIVAATKVFP